MASPLTRYVSLTYAKCFILLLVPFAVVALPVAMDPRMTYLMILPLAAVDVGASLGTLLLLAGKGELETLQAYGVPERYVAIPLARATCTPLLLFSAAAIALSADRVSALVFAAVGVIATIFLPLVIVRRYWQRR